MKHHGVSSKTYAFLKLPPPNLIASFTITVWTASSLSDSTYTSYLPGTSNLIPSAILHIKSFS